MAKVSGTGAARQVAARHGVAVGTRWAVRVPSVTRAVQAAHDARDTQVSRPRRGRSPEPRPAAGAPWQYAKHVSTLLDPDADLRKQRRHVRRAQRSVLWEKSRLERVRGCGRVPIDTVTVRDKAGVAHFAGLATCGSIWACPVCSAKIRNHRATEIAEATAAWHRAGNTVAMVTLTFPHDMSMRLAKLLPVVADGFRQLISGRAWAGTPERFVPERPSKRGGMLPARYYPAKPGVRDQLGIVGTIRSVEVTHGENGWHPHAHVLVYAEGDMSAEGIVQLILYLRKRWSAWVTSQGYRVPHELHGVDVSMCSSAAEAGAYIAKTQDGRSPGNELARADLKQGRDGSRTPFEILDDFRWTGDVEDLALWHEYEKATKGHQCITWSKGLRAILAVEEHTDEEVAAEEVGGQDIAQIPADVWRRIVAIPGLDSAVLDAAESAGLTGINELLNRHGIGQAHAPPPVVPYTGPAPWEPR
jgi:hypothetical protein